MALFASEGDPGVDGKEKARGGRAGEEKTFHFWCHGRLRRNHSANLRLASEAAFLVTEMLMLKKMLMLKRYKVEDVWPL